MGRGTLIQISTSPGGVPKVARPEAWVTVQGLEGDGHEDTKHHGGPERAVCLFSLEVIEALRAEGHPIAPGTIGENLTVSGLHWPQVVPGSRLMFEGGVQLEIASFTTPCSTIRRSFLGAESNRVKQELHPGQSRVYARVLKTGRLRTGERVELVGPPTSTDPSTPS